MSSEFSSGTEQQEAPEQRRVEPSSSNVPLVAERTANGEVYASFAHYRERFGRADLPGIVLCFATNPALLKGMLEIAENFLFSESLLGAGTKR